MAEALLSRVRARLGFQPAEVAAAGGWSRAAYAALERSTALDVDDVLRLEDLLGVDVGQVLERGKIRTEDVAVAALLKGNADTLSADARFAVTAALSVARDVRKLERLLGTEPSVSVASFREDNDIGHPDSGNAIRLADDLRCSLGLTGVVRSLIRDVTERLGVLVFAVPFNDPQVDALSTWTPASGPIIVVNWNSPHGRGEYALRVTLAHELCHLLFDREKMRTVASFCELEKPRHSAWPREQDAIERRARAFQVEFIAPRTLILDEWEKRGRPKGDDAIVALSNHFGLGAVAMGWQLQHCASIPFNGGSGLTAFLDTSGWDEIRAVSPIDEPATVPSMRRGRLLTLVREGTVRGELSSSWAKELLRLDTADWDALVQQWT